MSIEPIAFGDPENPPDNDGDGVPDSGEAIVIGKRRREVYEPGQPGTDVPGGGGSLGGVGESAPPPPPRPLDEDCLKDNQANKITDEINKAPKDGQERGALTYRDENGALVPTAVVTGIPGQVSVEPPPGVSASQVVGFVHSHPLAPRSGDEAVDAKYDAADRYPSPTDWDQMDALVAAGADPSKLSFYVIDKDGIAREYNYSDKAIYDVPEEQLLGEDGHPAPPPLPDPLPPEREC